MRIAIISYEYPPDTALGGIATYSQQLALMLSSVGHCVEVFTASPRRSGYHQSKGIRINLVGQVERADFPAKVRQAFSERNIHQAFDVVESPEFGADGSEVLRSHPSIAHVVKLHTPRELLRDLDCRSGLRARLRCQKSKIRELAKWCVNHRQADYGPPLEKIERNYVQSCHFVVSPSRDLLDWSKSRWNVDPKRSMVIPNPYIPSADLLNLSTREGNNLVVGFVGRLEYRKGIVDFVNAIPRVLRQEPATLFRLVGNPSIHPSTHEPFDKFVLRKLRHYLKNIYIAGPQPLTQMPAEYSEMDVCVFPSIWENFPNVCLEAMSAGKAVVASRAGGMSEMLECGGGLLIQPHDPRGLTEAVVKLIRSPQLRADLGAKGRAKVLRSYSAKALRSLVENSYKRAIATSHEKLGYTPRS